MSSGITLNKKHLLKQVVTITYITEKKFFTVATFEGLGIVSFQTVKKNSRILGLHESSLDFKRRKDQINTDYNK